MRQLNSEQVTAIVGGGPGSEGNAYQTVDNICDAQGFPGDQVITVSFSTGSTVGAFGSSASAGISYETEITCSDAEEAVQDEKKTSSS